MFITDDIFAYEHVGTIENNDAMINWYEYILIVFFVFSPFPVFYLAIVIATLPVVR